MTEWIAWLHTLDPRQVITAAADILIVAFIVYRVLLMLRGTGAAYMLVGLLAVAGVVFASRMFTLRTLSWLLDQVIGYAIVIVIIVFQSDIRRGLTRVGRRLFLFQQSGEDVTAINDVVESCASMARSKTGALIVFERDADLSAIIERAIRLDALVSPGLLHNVFAPWPDNPLHDGAVVIKGGRIKQAAAVLPLSMQFVVDNRMGTRHRAAIGITEETDAVAVVVSEQRGVISLCVGGQIRTGLSATALRLDLLAMLSPPVDRSPWVWLGRIVRGVERTIVNAGPHGQGRGGQRPMGVDSARLSTLRVPVVKDPPHEDEVS